MSRTYGGCRSKGKTLGTGVGSQNFTKGLPTRTYKGVPTEAFISVKGMLRDTGAMTETFVARRLGREVMFSSWSDQCSQTFETSLSETVQTFHERETSAFPVQPKIRSVPVVVCISRPNPLFSMYKYLCSRTCCPFVHTLYVGYM